MKKALLVLFAIGWFLCGFAQEIKFETTVHDFGEVFHNAPAVCDFVFTNTGTEPLLVQKPKSSCGCTRASWPKEPIMPGEKGMVTVTYDSRKIGNINKTITVASNAINSPQVILRVKGNVLESKIKAIQKNGWWGCEDSNGNVIVPFQYEALEENEIGFSAKKNGKWGVIDLSNNIIIPFENDQVKISTNGNKDINIMRNGKWGVVDRENHVIIPCKYDEEFHIATTVSVKKGGKWGVIDNTDKTIIPFDYEEKIERLFWLKEGMKAKRKGKWGIIDNSNRLIIPFEYDALEDKLCENKIVFVTKKNDKWGIVDNSNKSIIPFEYDAIEFGSYKESDMVFVVKKYNKWGVINKSNQIIAPFDFEEIQEPNARIILCAKKKGLWGIINKTNNQLLVDFVFEDIQYYPRTNETFFVGKNKTTHKWGAFSINGRKLLDCKFDYPGEVLTRLFQIHEMNADFTK